MEVFSALLALVRGIYRSPVNSSHKGQWRGALMFSFICTWIKGWVNNREADDLRRLRTHYDVTVMLMSFFPCAHFPVSHPTEWYAFYSTMEMGAHEVRLQFPFIMDIYKEVYCPLLNPLYNTLQVIFLIFVNIYGNKNNFHCHCHRWFNQANNKENINGPLYTLWGGLPAQTVSNMESVSISWRRHNVMSASAEYGMEDVSRHVNLICTIMTLLLVTLHHKNTSNFRS